MGVRLAHGFATCVATVLCLSGSSLALAAVPDTTRTSAYDWQCERADGTLVSGHQRQDKAIVACQNVAQAEPGQTFIIRGGTYRVMVPAVVVEPPPPATVDAVLTWTAPDRNVDGTPLTDLAGFKLYVRLIDGPYGDGIDIAGADRRSFTLALPKDGKQYAFAMTAYNAKGEESMKTNEVSKVMQ